MLDVIADLSLKHRRNALQISSVKKIGFSKVKIATKMRMRTMKGMTIEDKDAEIVERIVDVIVKL